MEIGTNSGTILAVYLALLLFGMGFNWLVAWAETKKYMEGYTAFAVVAGVGITLAVTAIFSPIYALITLGAFAASGLPMVAGSIYRHVKARQAEQEAIKHDKG